MKHTCKQSNITIDLDDLSQEVLAELAKRSIVNDKPIVEIVQDEFTKYFKKEFNISCGCKE